MQKVVDYLQAKNMVHCANFVCFKVSLPLQNVILFECPENSS